MAVDPPKLQVLSQATALPLPPPVKIPNWGQAFMQGAQLDMQRKRLAMAEEQMELQKKQAEINNRLANKRIELAEQRNMLALEQNERAERQMKFNQMYKLREATKDELGAIDLILDPIGEEMYQEYRKTMGTTQEDIDDIYSGDPVEALGKVDQLVAKHTSSPEFARYVARSQKYNTLLDVATNKDKVYSADDEKAAGDLLEQVINKEVDLADVGVDFTKKLTLDDEKKLIDIKYRETQIAEMEHNMALEAAEAANKVAAAGTVYDPDWFSEATGVSKGDLIEYAPVQNYLEDISKNFLGGQELPAALVRQAAYNYKILNDQDPSNDIQFNSRLILGHESMANQPELATTETRRFLEQDNPMISYEVEFTDRYGETQTTTVRIPYNEHPGVTGSSFVDLERDQRGQIKDPTTGGGKYAYTRGVQVDIVNQAGKELGVGEEGGAESQVNTFDLRKAIKDQVRSTYGDKIADEDITIKGERAVNNPEEAETLTGRKQYDSEIPIAAIRGTVQVPYEPNAYYGKDSWKNEVESAIASRVTQNLAPYIEEEFAQSSDNTIRGKLPDNQGYLLYKMEGTDPSGNTVYSAQIIGADLVSKGEKVAISEQQFIQSIGEQMLQGADFFGNRQNPYQDTYGSPVRDEYPEDTYPIEVGWFKTDADLSQPGSTTSAEKKEAFTRAHPALKSIVFDHKPSDSEPSTFITEVTRSPDSPYYKEGTLHEGDEDYSTYAIDLRSTDGPGLRMRKIYFDARGNLTPRGKTYFNGKGVRAILEHVGKYEGDHVEHIHIEVLK